jgi:hypothetical protein
VKSSAKVSSVLYYSIQDSYEDAADFNSNEPGNQEFNGGAAFEITGGWRILQWQRSTPESCKEDL